MFLNSSAVCAERFFNIELDDSSLVKGVSALSLDLNKLGFTSVRPMSSSIEMLKVSEIGSRLLASIDLCVAPFIINFLNAVLPKPQILANLYTSKPSSLILTLINSLTLSIEDSRVVDLKSEILISLN